jgi:hypothetical protein
VAFLTTALLPSLAAAFARTRFTALLSTAAALFLPPLSDLLTVAHARFSASFFETPRFS